MNLTITSEAKEPLKSIVGDSYLLLWYDTDDLGCCGVNGLPMVRIVQEKQESHERVENEDFPILINKQQKVFFNENMKLDYINGMFRLTSPEGILNPFISQNRITQ